MGGILCRALPRNVTRWNISVGNLCSNVGKDNLSLAMALAEDPRLIIRFMTCMVQWDPLNERRPDVAL